MKILVISEVFYPENFMINDLVREWKKQGHLVDIISQYPSYPYGYVFEGYKNKGESVELWENSKIFRFRFIEGYKDSKFRKFANYLLFVKGSRKIIIKQQRLNKYDHIFVSQTGPLTVALSAVMLRKKHKLPISIWTFDIWPDVIYSYGVPKIKILDKLLDNFIGYIYNNCNNIFVSSEKFADVINRYTKNQCIYVPNWLQKTDDIASSIKFDKGKINFTFTGNVSLFQNLMLTVQAFVKADIPNAIFNIVGDGSALKTLEDYILENNVTNVQLYRRIPSKEVMDTLQQSDFLVLPLISNDVINKTEPLKLQSYSSAYKPIFGICSGVGKEIIEENNLGICSNPSDIDDIAKGFIQMLEFKDKYADAIEQHSQRLLETRFNKDVIIKRINSYLEKDVETFNKEYNA